MGIRDVGLGRKRWLFAGSDGGTERAVAVNSLNETVKAPEFDLEADLCDVLGRIAYNPIERIQELLPGNCAAAKHAQMVRWLLRRHDVAVASVLPT